MFIDLLIEIYEIGMAKVEKIHTWENRLARAKLGEAWISPS